MWKVLREWTWKEEERRGEGRCVGVGPGRGVSFWQDVDSMQFFFFFFIPLEMFDELIYPRFKICFF